MDPLPARYPIPINAISSPPFECAGDGLTFKGHSRASIADLTTRLYPAGENTAPFKKSKDWWQAQLRLYGLAFKASATIANLTGIFKDALSKGLQSPTEKLLQLEVQLNRQFLLKNAAARDQEYSTLDDNKKAEKYSEKFLQEKFFNGESSEDLMVLKISCLEVYQAADKLGLNAVGAQAPGAQRGNRIIVGKDEAAVWRQQRAIIREHCEWEEEERNAKRRKMDMSRKECEAGGKGSFKDVEGEWSIDCESMDREYRKADRKMSIFFHKPRKEYHSDDNYGSNSDGDQEDAKNETPVASSPLLLCANFKMGILEGMLRARRKLLPSTSFPVTKISFTWRGVETGEGEIQLDYEGDTNLGSFTFLSKTKVKGVLKSSFGNFPFSGCKMSKVPVDTEDVWDNFSESQYESARVGRWG